MTYEAKPLTARLGIKGTFECRDKDGNVLKSIEIDGSVPIELAQAEELLKEANGPDDRQ